MNLARSIFRDCGSKWISFFNKNNLKINISDEGTRQKFDELISKLKKVGDLLGRRKKCY